MRVENYPLCMVSQSVVGVSHWPDSCDEGKQINQGAGLRESKVRRIGN